MKFANFINVLLLTRAYINRHANILFRFSNSDWNRKVKNNSWNVQQVSRLQLLSNKPTTQTTSQSAKQPSVGERALAVSKWPKLKRHLLYGISIAVFVLICSNALVGCRKFVVSNGWIADFSPVHDVAYFVCACWLDLTWGYCFSFVAHHNIHTLGNCCYCGNAEMDQSLFVFYFCRRYTRSYVCF